MLNFILLQAEGGAGFDMRSLIMWGGILLVFFFFMILPQRKKQKQLKESRANMKEGDAVVTSGGIHGKIKAVKETTFVIEIGEGQRVTFEKNSVFASATDVQAGNR